MGYDEETGKYAAQFADGRVKIIDYETYKAYGGK